MYRIERILEYKLKEIVKVISWLLKAPPQIMSFPSDWVRCKPKIWKNAILDVAILGVPKKVEDIIFQGNSGQFLAILGKSAQKCPECPKMSKSVQSG